MKQAYNSLDSGSKTDILSSNIGVSILTILTLLTNCIMFVSVLGLTHQYESVDTGTVSYYLHSLLTWRRTEPTGKRDRYTDYQTYLVRTIYRQE